MRLAHAASELADARLTARMALSLGTVARANSSTPFELLDAAPGVVAFRRGKHVVALNLGDSPQPPPPVRDLLLATLESSAAALPPGGAMLATVGREHPQVVLMDLSMPVVDGVEATRRIVTADPEVRVVVLTS